MMTVAATHAHIAPLLARMDPADVLMVNARSRFGAVAELAQSIAASVMTWCGIDAAGPVIMGGIIPTGTAGATGMVWQAATPALRLHGRTYIQQGRDIIRQAAGRFERLAIRIRASFHAALRHVRRLGFVLVTPLHVDGIAMHELERVL